MNLKSKESETKFLVVLKNIYISFTKTCSENTLFSRNRVSYVLGGSETRKKTNFNFLLCIYFLVCNIHIIFRRGNTKHENARREPPHAANISVVYLKKKGGTAVSPSYDGFCKRFSPCSAILTEGS